MTGFENIRKNFGFGCMRLPIVLGGCRSYFARNKLCHNLCSIFPAACFDIIPIEQTLGNRKGFKAVLWGYTRKNRHAVILQASPIKLKHLLGSL